MIKLNYFMKGVCHLLIFMTLTFVSKNLFAQDKSISQLEDEITSAQRQIDLVNQMLKSNDSEQMSNLEKLTLIKSQITNRENIVRNLREQSRVVQNNISSNTKTVNSLTTEQKQLQEEYANYMVISYKNYIFSNGLLFLFSAKDFNDLQMRIYYLKKYSQMKYDMSVRLEEKANRISIINDSLVLRKKEYDGIVKKTQSEVANLKQANVRYNNTLNGLKKERNKLYKDIKTHQDNIKKLQARIGKIIAEEARKQKELAEKSSLEYKEKYKEQSAKFAALKGKLEVPIEKGIISERFGTHPHPIHKSLMVQNKGINYHVPYKSDVNAVHLGVVTKIFFFQGTNNSVMIRHGDYITTYSGLTEVNVKSGDIVSAGQKIGTITKGGTLHFELWKGTNYYNPEPWFKK